MGGAQPLGATMAGAAALCVEVDPSRIERRLTSRYLDEATASLDDAVDRVQSAAREGRALSVGLLGNAAEVIPELARRGVRFDLVTDQTAAHDPLNGYVPVGLSVDAAAELRAATRTSTSVAPLSRLRSTSAACSSSSGPGAMFSTTATTYEGRRNRPASKMRSHTRASSRPIFGRSSAAASGPSGGPCCRETRRTSRRSTGRCEGLFPDDFLLQRWLDLAPERVAFQGLPARICWLGYGDRAKAGLAINELVSSGAVSAPVVIGRDHLDSGSVASPYRETEAMRTAPTRSPIGRS